MLDGRHVLRDLRTEIGAIDHSRVTVWVHTIYAVSIESEGRAGLHCLSLIHIFLMDMKALNLQNRTFAIIENGSWAVKSGDLMQKFVNNELKNMTVLNERLSLASSMGTDKRTELEALADAILESMK